MTALKTIPKTTVNGAIKLARLPADTMLRAAPESVASSARLAVDSADAAVRNAAGAALRDPQLRDESKRLRAAVAERRRALGLAASEPVSARTGRGAGQEDTRRGRQASPAGRSRGQAQARAGPQAPRAEAGGRQEGREAAQAGRAEARRQAARQGQGGGPGRARRRARDQGQRARGARARANRDG